MIVLANNVGQLENVKVSVVVPIYKVEKYLMQCVDSILSQTHKNLEVILVDDGSPDCCPKICDQYANIEHRVRVIHKENEGLTSARKAGVLMSTGDYVIYVDGDDWIETDYLENMLSPLAYAQVDIISNISVYMNYSDGRQLERMTPMQEGVYQREDFIKGIYPNYICEDRFYDTSLPTNVYLYLFNRELLSDIQGQVDNEISIGEDMAITFRALLHAESMAVIKRPGYHYRQHADSMLHKKTDDYFQRIHILCENLRHAVNDAVPSMRASSMKGKIPIGVFFALWTGTPKIFTDLSKEFLFPYRHVKNGSKIFVYGMGVVGRGIIEAIHSSGRFVLVGCSDQGWQQYADGFYFGDGECCKVYDSARIKDCDFDWLVIGVSRAGIRQEIQEYLFRQGIEKAKIAEIDIDLLIEENLPF